MIPETGRSILLLFCCIIIFKFPAAGDPLTVIDSFQYTLSMLPTMHADVVRKQLFRNNIHKAEGRVLFTPKSNCFYNWRSPGAFTLFSSDTLLYGINKKTLHGWRLRNPSTHYDLHTRIDPLHHLFQLLRYKKSAFTFRGTGESLLLFSLPLSLGKKCIIGFETTPYRCRIIETFSYDSTILRKITFNYDPSKKEALIPAIITISEPVGNSIAIDSLFFKRIRKAQGKRSKAFTLPRNITWRNWKEYTRSTEELDTIPY